MAKMQQLYCHNGQHSWERESKRGRRPENCPDHPGIAVVGGAEGDETSQQATYRPRFDEEDARRLAQIFDYVEFMQAEDLKAASSIVRELWGHPEAFSKGSFDPTGAERDLRKRLKEILKAYEPQAFERRQRQHAYGAAMPLAPGTGGKDAWDERYADAMSTYSEDGDPLEAFDV